MRNNFRTRLVIVSIILIIYVLFTIFIDYYPRVTITYKGSQYSKADVQIIKILQNLEWGEICDPLPGWLELKVVNITGLDEAETMLDNAPVPIRRTNQIPAIELISNGKINEGKLIKCPPYSHIVTVLITQPSWSRLFSSNYTLTGRKIKFCVNTNE